MSNPPHAWHCSGNCGSGPSNPHVRHRPPAGTTSIASSAPSSSVPSATSPKENSSADGTTWRSRPTFSSTRATLRPRAWALAMRTTESAIASSCTARASADPRQGVADELVHDPPPAERRLDEHHPRRLGADLADLARLLAAGHGPQRGEPRVRVLGRDERHQLALVRDVHRIDAEDLGGARHRRLDRHGLL